MSAIFLSHSSKDNAVADEVRARLGEQGHTSVFLDFDPDIGIPAGRNWEKELYAQLRACRAVLIIGSEHWLASKWCFAEITHARALGKAIFPLKVGASALDALRDIQVIDLTTDREGGYARLWRGLKAAGLDPSDIFDWDGHRPPYPGLLAFRRKTQRSFSGVTPEIRLTIETLNRLRDLGGSRFVMMLGASGSGKSSLLRAGVLPRLRRERARWIVVPAFRPLDRPFDGLAASLANALASHGITRDWKEIRQLLQGPGGSGRLEDIVQELRASAGQLEAMVALPVDQVEELLGGAASGDAVAFLSLLREATESTHGGALVIGTLRSDFLAAFQTHPASRETTIAEVLINAMPMNRVGEIIEGPAGVAGIELQPGLVQAMVEDTGTDDALPLLAFALRQLCDRHGQDRRLTVEEYQEQLGGLQGAIARSAESLLEEHRASPQEQGALRDAFLAMARVNEEGHFVRRPAKWDELPSSVQPLLERFVRARLLVSRGQEGSRYLEVAHEALFRNWKRLSDWLEQDRTFLLWRKRLADAMEYWKQGGEARERLWSGAPLREADAWLRERARHLAPDEARFIGAGLSAQHRARRNLSLVVAAVAAGLVGLAALTVINALQAERSAESAKARAIVSMARSMSDTDPLTGALILAELGSGDEPPGALGDALDIARQPIPFSIFRKLGTLATISPDGSRVASAGSDGSVHLFETGARGVPKSAKIHESGIEDVAFSPDGNWIVTASSDHTARVFGFDKQDRPRVLPHDKRVVQALFSPNGSLILTASEDGTAKVWRLDSEKPVLVITHKGQVRVARFSADSALVVTGSDDGTAQVVHVDGTAHPVILAEHKEDVRGVAFSPDGQYRATASRDRTARVWRTDGSGPAVVLAGHTGDVRSVAFDSGGSRVVTASEDGTARVWPAEGGEAIAILRARGAPLWEVALDANGRILTLGEDSTVRVWPPDGAGPPVELKHEDSVQAAALSRDGRRLVTATLGGIVRMWRMPPDGVPRTLPGPPMEVPELLSDIVVSANSRLIASLLMNHPVMIWDAEMVRDSILLRQTGVGTRTAVFTHDGTRLITGHYGGSMRVVNTDGTAEAIELASHDRDIIALGVTRDSQQVHSVSLDGVIRVQSTDGKTPGRATSIGPLCCAAFSTDGRIMVAGSSDGAIRVWRSDGGDTPIALGRHGESLRGIGMSQDGSRLMSISERSVWVWPVTSGAKPIVLTHPQSVRSASLSPDGTRVISVSTDGTRLWTVDKQTSVLLPRSDPALSSGHGTSAAFSPDGRRIVATFSDGTAQLWSHDTSGTPLLLRYEAKPLVKAAFSPDGARLFLIPQKGPAQMWIVGWPEVSRYTRARTTACLSAEERERYLAESSADVQARASQCASRFGPLGRP